MPYAIITRDKPDSLQLRNATRQPHLEYLTANQDKLLAAGAEVDDAGQGGTAASSSSTPRTAPRPRRSSRTIRSPRPGLFAGVEVVRWRKAFFNKQRLI